jgi:hypothetical protein
VVYRDQLEVYSEEEDDYVYMTEAGGKKNKGKGKNQ